MTNASAGARIVEGLRDAVSGNFAAVTIEGQRWTREPSWQPIDSAPKDQFIFLYCLEDNTRWLAKWQGERWCGVDAEHGFSREGYSAGDPDVVTGWAVTNWMPLPNCPVQS